MSYIGRTPVVGNFVKLDAITTSATATYNLLNGGVAYFPQTANNCIVSLNGVIQSPTSAYTISGSTIVFSDALTASDSIDFILVLGDVLNIGTPSDATVGFSKVTSNLITGATAETSIAGGDSVLIYDDSASALRKMTRTNFVAGVGGTNTPAFQATVTTNQTISHNTDTKVQFSSETFDTNSAYDPTTNYRFTVPAGEGGKYFIYTSINLQGTNNREHEVVFAIKVNGTNNKQSIVGEDITQSTVMPCTLSTTVTLVPTDYVEIFVYQYDYTASSTMNVLNDARAVFGGYKLIGV